MLYDIGTELIALFDIDITYAVNICSDLFLYLVKLNDSEHTVSLCSYHFHLLYGYLNIHVFFLVYIFNIYSIKCPV